MGKTHRRNDRYKKDRRDRTFRKSKKFKDLNKHPKYELPIPNTVADETTDPEYDNNDLS